MRNVYYIYRHACIIILLLLSKICSCVDQKYIDCAPRNCGNQSISFPFFIAGQQQSYCGVPGFNITCRDSKYPLLHIPEDSQSLLIQEIFHENRTFRVSNADLGSDIGNCGAIRQISRDLTVRGDRFQLISDSKLVLLWNCTDGARLDGYRVDCDDTNYLVMNGNDKNLDVANKSCKLRAEAPITTNDQVITRLNYSTLMTRGFLLKWTAPDCKDCKASGGRCGTKLDDLQFQCYCQDIPHYKDCATTSKALAAIFQKREVAAAAGSGLNTSRSRKRQATPDDIQGTSSPSGVKVPDFLNCPVGAEEDPFPFEIKWGIRNRDSAVGDTRASVEWSKHVVTPRDRAQIVESCNDLQLESMLSQDVATVNTYSQAAFHNLREARQDLTISNRDRDRYKADCATHFNRFREVEKELAAEKEISRRLREDLAKGEDEVVNNFKSSEAYSALMDAEYEAGVADSFESCWIKAVESIGERISEVNLKNFPVPGASTAQRTNMVLDVNDSEATQSPLHVDDYPLDPLNFENPIPQEDRDQED